MGIIKNYTDGIVVAENRYLQFQTKNLPLQELIKKKMIGYVNRGIFFVIYWENDKYYKCFFAKNRLWFNALINDVELISIKELPQITLI
jgi:hypothetical protein